MALLWIEGYEGYGTTTGTNINTYMGRRYPTHDFSSNWYITAGRFGGYAGRGNGNYYAGTPSLTNCDTVVFGLAVQGFTTGAFGSNWVIRLMDGTTAGVGFKPNFASGEVDVYLDTTLIGSTTDAKLRRNWFYLEAKVKCHDTEGTIEVRVDGVTRLSLSGIDTKNGTHSYHDILRIYLSTEFYLDDIYFLDTTGTKNNDFIGPQTVVGLRPNGDSGTIEWTPSSGETHYNLVDETRDNDDTDYVESTTSGLIDLWDYQALSGIDIVTGLQVNTTVKRSDATAYTLISRVYSGTTASDDSGQSAGSSYDAKCFVLEDDPDTGVAWTPSGVDAIQCGVKVA